MQSIKKTFSAIALFAVAVVVAPGNLVLGNPTLAKVQAFIAVVLMLVALMIAFTSFFKAKQQPEIKKPEQKGLKVQDLQTLDADTLRSILMDEKQAGKYLILER